MSFGAPSLKGRALRYLSQREHSRAELERKLARHVEDSDAALAQTRIAQLLDELAALDLLSETRVAESVARSHASRYGSRRLKQTLLAKGLDAALVTATVEQTRSTEFERASQIWRRRYGQPAASAAEKARQMRFLAGRGFDAEVIRRVLRAEPADAEADDAGV